MTRRRDSRGRFIPRSSLLPEGTSTDARGRLRDAAGRFIKQNNEIVKAKSDTEGPSAIKPGKTTNIDDFRAEINEWTINIAEDMALDFQRAVAILATDLADHAVAGAKAATYPYEALKDVPAELKNAWVKREGDQAIIAPELCRKVHVKRLNLLGDWPIRKQFDVIFCRNVMIYFDQPTKIDVFGRMQRVSEPDGYLFLGAAETVIGLTDAYRACPDLRGVYAPNPVRTSSPSLVPGLGMRSQKVFAAS